MKIKTKRNNSYSGDTSIAVQALNANGQYQTLFNLYPKKDKHGAYYENDRYPGNFETVKEAKDYAAQVSA